MNVIINNEIIESNKRITAKTSWMDPNHVDPHAFTLIENLLANIDHKCRGNEVFLEAQTCRKASFHVLRVRGSAAVTNKAW